jgi:hypothetical protein
MKRQKAVLHMGSFWDLGLKMSYEVGLWWETDCMGLEWQKRGQDLYWWQWETIDILFLVPLEKKCRLKVINQVEIQSSYCHTTATFNFLLIYVLSNIVECLLYASYWISCWMIVNSYLNAIFAFKKCIS